jgi:hypothetical protein
MSFALTLATWIGSVATTAGVLFGIYKYVKRKKSESIPPDEKASKGVVTHCDSPGGSQNILVVMPEPTQVSVRPEADDGALSSMTPAQIVGGIMALPPALRDDAEKKLKGMRVEWAEGRLGSISRLSNCVSVFVSFPNGYTSIWVSCDCKRIPNELTLAQENTLVTVTGKIEQISSDYIKINDAEVNIPHVLKKAGPSL